VPGNQVTAQAVADSDQISPRRIERVQRHPSLAHQAPAVSREDLLTTVGIVLHHAEILDLVQVLLDGQPIGQQGGDDVDKATSTATIGADRLYHLVHTTVPGAHILELKVQGVGLQAYTFTFG